ncbi:MAG: YceH family protein [Solirubrobacteraceae bacterium]
MHFDELTPPEQRVLGCLIEKRWTTPDQYPLSLNALRLACNQSTNRDPVTTYDEATVRQAADRLTKYGLARLASGHSSRATKYRHLAEEGLGLGREELAVLAVLLLRGPQTPGELKARSDRMAAIGSLSEVERVLSVLADRGYARRLGRRPGQKEDRFEQLMGGAGSQADSAEPIAAPYAPAPAHPAPAAPAPAAPSSPAHPAPPAAAPAAAAPEADGDLESRVRALEADVAALRAELARLRQAAPSAQVGSASPTR